MEETVALHDAVDRVEDLVRLNLRWLPHFVVCQVERISMPVCQQLTTSLLLCNDRRWFVRSFEALVVHLDETQVAFLSVVAPKFTINCFTPLRTGSV